MSYPRCASRSRPAKNITRRPTRAQALAALPHADADKGRRNNAHAASSKRLRFASRPTSAQRKSSLRFASARGPERAWVRRLPPWGCEHRWTPRTDGSRPAGNTPCNEKIQHVRAPGHASMHSCTHGNEGTRHRPRWALPRTMRQRSCKGRLLRRPRRGEIVGGPDARRGALGDTRRRLPARCASVSLRHHKARISMRIAKNGCSKAAHGQWSRIRVGGNSLEGNAERWVLWRQDFGGSNMSRYLCRMRL